jgi:hypothetical protein
MRYAKRRPDGSAARSARPDHGARVDQRPDCGGDVLDGGLPAGQAAALPGVVRRQVEDRRQRGEPLAHLQAGGTSRPRVSYPTLDRIACI